MFVEIQQNFGSVAASLHSSCKPDVTRARYLVDIDDKYHTVATLRKLRLSWGYPLF